jgi:DNA-binding MarR family transcriptional regulator
VLDLFVLHQHLTALMDQAFTGCAITPAQYAVYAQLGKEERTPGQLVETLGLRAATLSGYLKAMEGRGHLERERSGGDGRSSVLRLSDRGLLQLDEARGRLRSLVAIVEELLGAADDVTGVRRTLGRLDAAITDATR